jgi:arylsulfatase A-like enzyme
MRPKNPPLVLTEQRKWRTGAEPDEKAAREIQATYYGMNSKVDHLAGQVIDAMDRQNLWANTTVLLWFDYGDCAGSFACRKNTTPISTIVF